MVEYTVEYMNTQELTNNQLPRERQPMRRSYVLRNDWLKYAHGIAEYAYDQTDGMCVYHQLTTFLLNPPSGNPTKFIQTSSGNKRISHRSLFEFFFEWAQGRWGYENFDIEYGVTIEMVEALCEAIKRNMYAYDEDTKIISSVVLRVRISLRVRITVQSYTTNTTGICF